LAARFHLDELSESPLGSRRTARAPAAWHIVSALLHDPEVFVIDEPMVGSTRRHGPAW